MLFQTPPMNAIRTSQDSFVAVVIFALAAFWLVLFAGGKPGYDPDGANALHIALNVAAGEGVVRKSVTLSDSTLSPKPDITKPPLYSVSVGTLIQLGLPPKYAAWAVSGGAWAAMAALLYLIARQALPLPYALLVPIFTALQVTSLRWGISLHEESLFIALSLATLWRLTIITTSSSLQHWGQYALLGALSALSILASYQGLPLFLITALFVLISAQRDGGIKSIAAFGLGTAAVAAWPFLRFIHLWLAGIRPGFDPTSETTYYKMLAGIISGFQNDVLGRLFVWLYDGSLKDIILVTLFYSFLTAFLLHAAWSRRVLRPLAAYFVLYFVMLVAQWGGIGKAFYEPRYSLPLYGIFFLFMIDGVHRLAHYWKRPIAGVGFGAMALVLFAYGQSVRYPVLHKDNDAICPAPLTMNWIKRNIPTGSIIAAPQCGYQVIAESAAYYWLAIPPAGNRGTPVRWNESDILPACKFRVGIWIVLLEGKNKDPYLEKPGYGPFVTGLFNGQPGVHTELVNRTADGLVYRLHCEASGESGSYP